MKKILTIDLVIWVVAVISALFGAYCFAATAAVAAIIPVAIVLRTYYFFGEFHTIRAHYEGTCKRVDGLAGPEDINIDPQTGLAFISCGDMRTYRAGLSSRGDIYSLDWNTQGGVPQNLTKRFDREFHPHGISIYRDPGDGKLYLFAVNHTVKEPEDGHFVEIFEYVDGLLEHRQTVSHPLMFCPNDVLGVGPRSFYVSNDHGTPEGSLSRKVENLVPLKLSYVLYYDGKGMRMVAKHIAVSNGLCMTADGKTIYVAATLGKAVYAFNRDAATGELSPSFKIDLGFMPDNIELDAAGNIYAATRPKMITSKRHDKDINMLSPSQVMKVTIRGRGDYTVEEIFLDDGSGICSATVAAPFKGGMLIGQAKANHILICTDR